MLSYTLCCSPTHTHTHTHARTHTAVLLRKENFDGLYVKQSNDDDDDEGFSTSSQYSSSNHSSVSCQTELIRAHRSATSITPSLLFKLCSVMTFLLKKTCSLQWNSPINRVTARSDCSQRQGLFNHSCGLSLWRWSLSLTEVSLISIQLTLLAWNNNVNIAKAMVEEILIIYINHSLVLILICIHAHTQ